MSQFDKRNLSMMMDTHFIESYKEQKSVAALDIMGTFYSSRLGEI